MRQNSYPGKIIRILLLCLNTDMRTMGTVPIVSFW